MNKTCEVFREVQLRHAKRMVKIMEHLLKFPDDYMLLEVLVAEEHEKRQEDLEDIMAEVGQVKGSQLQKTMEVLAREITDPTVVFFLQRQVQRLKEIRGI